MRGADVNVRVDVVGPMVVIATQLNEAELSRRHKQVRTTNLITTSKNYPYTSLFCVYLTNQELSYYFYSPLKT
jgi:hypothetical protein